MAFINEKDHVMRKPRQPFNSGSFPRGGIVTNPEKNQELLAAAARVKNVTGRPNRPMLREDNLTTSYRKKPYETAKVKDTGVALAPHLFPPEDADFFDAFPLAAISIPASVAPPALGVKTLVLTYTVPSGKEGWFKLWGQDVETVGGWSNLTWYIELNGTPIYPYGPITRQLGTITEGTEILKYLDEGDTLNLYAANNSAGALSVWGRFKGWIYNKR